MLYVIGWGVFTLITLRIVQASVAQRPKVMLGVTIASVLAGIGFSAWLWLQYASTEASKGGGFNF